jgi:hypothetical protein
MAEGVITATIQRPEFREMVLAAPYSYRRRKTGAGRWDEPAPNVIYDLIWNGKEMLDGEPGKLDLWVKIIQIADPDVMGSVAYAGAKVIRTDVDFFNSWVEHGKAGVLAAHWLHEWMHVAGFAHRKDVTKPVRRKDVPYTVAKILKKMWGMEKVTNALEAEGLHVGPIEEADLDYDCDCFA